MDLHISFLEQPEMKDVFSSFYILPSLFNTDLDRGFSVIDYRLNDLNKRISMRCAQWELT